MSRPVIQLIIPRLFQPLIVWQKDFGFQPEAPNLSKLLTHYEAHKSHPQKGVDASLFASLGFEDKELPSAYYRLQTHFENNKSIKKGGGVLFKSILCADPIHLEVGLNDITLTDRIKDLSANQAEEIITALNQHFNQDGLQFILGSAGQWYLSLAEKESILTTPVDEVLRKNIVSYQPQSSTRNWQIIQTEIQMLLHSLPVNSQREKQGLATVNSLWFWGSGQPQTVKTTINSVFGTAQSKGKTLAQAAQCPWQRITDETKFSPLLAQLSGNNIFILDHLTDAANYDDVERYQQQLTTLDKTIIAPLLEAWQTQKIDLLIDGCDGKLLKLLKVPGWQFWANKPTSLLKIASVLGA